METATLTVKQFVSANRIRMSADWTDSNPAMEDSRDMDHWKCVLRMGNKRMTVVFSQGFGHNGRAPKVEDVLDCLASDASSAGEDFEDWCNDYGYDCDSRKAEKTWKAIQKQSDNLHRFLGPDLFEQITSGGVERL